MSFEAHNEAYGDFGLPTKRRDLKRHALVAVATAALVFSVGAQVTTHVLARRLGYQPGLGEPAFTVRDVPVYGSWKLAAWTDMLRNHMAGAELADRVHQWLTFSACLALTAGLVTFVRRTRAQRNRSDEIHGSARWATCGDIERAGLFAQRGVVVGKWVDPRSRSVRYLRHDGPEHVLTFAPTGAGKGVGLVLPTLLTWPASTLVLDPKGENFAKTSGYRKSIGQRIYKLDFAASPSETAAFNPLDAVRVGTPQETADVQRIARLIVDPDGKQFEGPNKHWAETAASLLTGTILHVLYRERLSHKSATLAQVVDELSDRARPHAQVLQDWLDFQHDPSVAQGWRDQHAPTATHPIVAACAREQLNREDKERSAVLSSAITPLGLFRDPLLAANTSRSDFRIEELMDADVPLSVYFVLRPADIQRLRPIVRIVLDLTLRRLVETMTFAGGEVVTTHKHKLLLMLDEFPVLGKLDVFNEALAYIRGWGIKAYLITQDYEQLRASYGDRETISSNCQLRLAYAPNKFETAKQLSQLTGAATIIRRSHGRSMSLGALAQRRDSESEQEVARALLTPDECMRLPGAKKQGDVIVAAGDMLVFSAGCPPIYAKQPLYFRNPTLLARSKIPPAMPRPLGKGANPRSVAPAATSSQPTATATSAALPPRESLLVATSTMHTNSDDAANTAPPHATSDVADAAAQPSPFAGELDDELLRLGLGVGSFDSEDIEDDDRDNPNDNEDTDSPEEPSDDVCSDDAA